MTATQPTLPDRTGTTNRLVEVDGQQVGAAMIEVLQVVLRDFDGKPAPTRNQIRLRCDNQSQGRVYPVVDRCVMAGLLEPAQGKSSYPVMKITERGAAAIVKWLTPPESEAT